jgi:TRAP transporter TAXI family solute receptor
MNPLRRITLFALLSAGLLAALPLRAEEHFLTIGSGDITGVYYPVGRIIAELVNAQRGQHGIRASVEPTRGSVFNLNALGAGYLELGLAQSDKQHEAVRGLNEWAARGPQNRLRSLFSLHHETVNLVAAADSGIRTIADLKGRRVNVGNPRSGQYQNALDALRAAGLDPASDLKLETSFATEAPQLLQDQRIDAFFCTLGHPSGTLKEAVSGKRKVRFIPVTGPGVDRLIAENGYYIRTRVPVTAYYARAEGAEDVETFAVVATLNAAADVPDEAIYQLTRAVFDNFDAFRQKHPALAGLRKADMLSGLAAPLHPGALRYFREAGLKP